VAETVTPGEPIACPEPPPCAGSCDTAIRQISVGVGHACAIDRGGALRCWGDDERGQLGALDREVRTTPVPVASSVDAVAAGEGFTCLLEAGKVRCLGALREPGPADPEAMIEAGCAASPDLAMCSGLAEARRKRERFAGGRARYEEGLRAVAAELAAERTTPPALTPPILDAVAIGAGGTEVCTLNAKGEATCFAYAAPDGQIAFLDRERVARPTRVPGTAGLVEVVASPALSCGRTATGEVLCWSAREPASRVPLPGQAQAIAVGIDEACAATSEGAVWCWSTRGSSPPARREGLADVVEVRAQGRSACARTSSGRVSCWGQLGDVRFAGSRGARSSESPLEIAGARGATALAVGTGHACVVASDGVRCFGGAMWGALGDGASPEVTRPVGMELGTSAVDVSTGAFASCAALGEKGVSCWGQGYGDAETPAEGPARATIPLGVPAERVFVGEQSACALSGGVVHCWGHTARPEVQRIDGIDDAVSVSVELVLGCAARRGGSLSCWWWGRPPAPVPGLSELVEVSYGASDWSCGRTRSGGAVCWSMPMQAPTPAWAAPKLVPFGLPDAVSVSTAAFRACAVRQDGTLACARSTDTPLRPRPQPGWSDLVQVAVSNQGVLGAQLCGRTRSGEVLCQGDARVGALGNGSTRTPPLPGIAKVDAISDARHVAVGGSHACALREGGRVACWGSDTFGQVTGVARGLRTCARPIAR
jgi:alpha-tubulin suppressor-like RCC1 family protein